MLSHSSSYHHYVCFLLIWAASSRHSLVSVASFHPALATLSIQFRSRLNLAKFKPERPHLHLYTCTFCKCTCMAVPSDLPSPVQHMGQLLVLRTTNKMIWIKIEAWGVEKKAVRVDWVCNLSCWPPRYRCTMSWNGAVPMIGQVNTKIDYTMRGGQGRYSARIPISACIDFAHRSCHHCQTFHVVHFQSTVTSGEQTSPPPCLSPIHPYHRPLSVSVTFTVDY